VARRSQEGTAEQRGGREHEVDRLDQDDQQEGDGHGDGHADADVRGDDRGDPPTDSSRGRAACEAFRARDRGRVALPACGGMNK